ncbi:MAG: YHS domain-containing protein [Gemmataceae bacterium]|nr:YHS domain-containing protein [Gemmataceae bacterium]MDW8264205.1 YHS domain-containing protein [Gemmataceae bacterium]
MRAFALVGSLWWGWVMVLPSAEAPAGRQPGEALRAFHDLIGSWRGTGIPLVKRADPQRDFWQEEIAWSWKFKGQDAWLVLTINKGRHFTGGELRYLPDTDRYALSLRTVEGSTRTFVGTLKDRILTVDRTDETTGEHQRLVLTLLHSNRYLYRYEVKPADKNAFVRQYQVGATKEGEPFALGDGKPECIVSGGLGTSPVVYQGKTYYVCCSGCRDAFREDPEKYIREFEARKKR